MVCLIINGYHDVEKERMVNKAFCVDFNIMYIMYYIMYVIMHK